MRYGKRVAALAVVTSLVLVACGDDDEESGTGDTSAPEGTAATSDAPASGDTERPQTGPTRRTRTGGGGGGESLLGGEIPCDEQYDGKTVSVFSPVRNSETEPDAVATLRRLLPAVRGVHRRHDRLPGHRPVRDQVVVRIQGGNPPDVIDFPQPGLLRTLAESDGLIPFPENVAAHVPAATSSPVGRARHRRRRGLRACRGAPTSSRWCGTARRRSRTAATRSPRRSAS